MKAKSRKTFFVVLIAAAVLLLGAYLLDDGSILQGRLGLRTPHVKVTLVNSFSGVGPVAYTKGADGANFGEYRFACGGSIGGECTVSDVIFTGYLDEEGGVTFNPGVDNSVLVSDVVHTVWLENRRGSIVAGPEAVAVDGTVTFSDLSLSAMVGSSDGYFVLKGDVSNHAYYNNSMDSVGFVIATEADIVAENEHGDAIPTELGNSNLLTSTTLDYYIKVQDAGALTVFVHPDTPPMQTATSGDVLEFSKYLWEAELESFSVRNFTISVEQTGVTEADLGEYDRNLDKVIIKYTDSSGAPASSEEFLINGTARFSGEDIYVPADGNAELGVIGVVSASVVDGDSFRLALSFGTFDALGLSSGESFNLNRLSSARYGAYEDFDFGSTLFAYDVNSFALDGTHDLSPLEYRVLNTLTVDDGLDDNSNKLPVGTLICVDDNNDGICRDEDRFVVSEWPASSLGSEDDVAVEAYDLLGDAEYDDNDALIYALPAVGYLLGTHRVTISE